MLYFPILSLFLIVIVSVLVFFKVKTGTYKITMELYVLIVLTISLIAINIYLLNFFTKLGYKF
jgi:hypothetical protein